MSEQQRTQPTSQDEGGNRLICSNCGEEIQFNDDKEAYECPACDIEDDQQTQQQAEPN